MKGFFDCLKITFVIIGTMLGAGYLSGREVYQFFSGTDPLLSVAFVFILLFLGQFFILSSDFEKKSRLYKPIIAISYLGNIFIMSGMLSCINTIALTAFNSRSLSTAITIGVLIVSNLIQFSGAGGLKRVNLVLVPIILITLIFVVFIPNKITYVSSGKIAPISCLSYAGLNLFLGMPILMILGKNKAKTTSFFAAMLSSAVLAVLIFLIYASLSGSGVDALYSDIPLLNLINKHGVAVICYYFVLTFGVLTTLFSAHYSVFQILDNTFIGILYKILLSITAFLISRLSFLNIVAYIYPFIGIIGGILIIILVFEQAFFPKKPLKST